MCVNFMRYEIALTTANVKGRKQQMSLNPRQKRFAELYHLSGNATQSYMEVYGVSESVAAVKASETVRKGNFQEYLQSLQSEAREQFKTDRATMLGLFHEIAFSPVQETRDRISASKEICRIEGHYEAVKVAVSADSEVVEMLRGLTGSKE